MPLRFGLKVDSYMSQSMFAVEVFSRHRLQWNGLWSIPPTAYRIHPGTQDPALVADPSSTLIASPDRNDSALKAASWQKIIHEFTARADAILDG